MVTNTIGTLQMMHYKLIEKIDEIDSYLEKRGRNWTPILQLVEPSGWWWYTDKPFDGCSWATSERFSFPMQVWEDLELTKNRAKYAVEIKCLQDIRVSFGLMNFSNIPQLFIHTTGLVQISSIHRL